MKNIKNSYGEKCGDIYVKCKNNLNNKLSASLNSSAIDEFLIIFLAAAKAKRVRILRNLSELNKKVDSLDLKILNMIRIKINNKVIILETQT